MTDLRTDSNSEGGITLACEDYQAVLPDLLYGELDADVKPAALAHRASCSACDGLTRELETVQGSLPPLRPPPLLTARVKIAARDELLARAGLPASSTSDALDDDAPRGEPAPLRLALTLVLGLVLVVVAFGLGVAWERQAPSTADGRDGKDGKGGATDSEPRISIPRNPTDLPPGDPTDEPGDPRRPAGAPRAPDAWQRVLHDTAAGQLARGEHAQAETFFQRAVAVSPEGPLAAACRVGQAEAALLQGHRAAAHALLEETRLLILGGHIAATPALLQRLGELDAEARRP